jgi:DNA-binding NtrC family response regulator
MKELRRKIEKIANSNFPVLIVGETGTGKELVARAIYECNKSGQFVAVNCSTLTPNLLGTELFGHERGAFTGAVGRKFGLIEAANNGTLFLDEIGELPLESQAMLLRALEEGKLRPVGSIREIPVSFRLVSATNRDLKREVEKGTFREDLLWRLRTFKIEVPPLRQRKEDIPELAEYFLSQQQIDTKITPEILEAFQQHNWIGNVRQLQSCIRSMAAQAEGSRLSVRDLPASVFCNVPAGAHNAFGFSSSSTVEKQTKQVHGEECVSTLVEIEKSAILRALALCKNDRTATAVRLRIGRTTLYRRLRDYGIAS